MSPATRTPATLLDAYEAGRMTRPELLDHLLEWRKAPPAESANPPSALEALREFRDYTDLTPFKWIGTEEETRRLIVQAHAITEALKHVTESAPHMPKVDFLDALRGITTLLELADFSAAQDAAHA